MHVMRRTVMRHSLVYLLTPRCVSAAAVVQLAITVEVQSTPPEGGKEFYSYTSNHGAVFG